MRSTLMIVLIVGIVAAAIGLLALGAFPPQPHTQPVSKVLPNDRFQAH